MNFFYRWKRHHQSTTGWIEQKEERGRVGGLGVIKGRVNEKNSIEVSRASFANLRIIQFTIAAELFFNEDYPGRW
ncbi:hypothetical protein ACHQM5_013847 [Ranunculus cassubicifolius]